MSIHGKTGTTLDPETGLFIRPYFSVEGQRTFCADLSESIESMKNVCHISDELASLQVVLIASSHVQMTTCMNRIQSELWLLNHDPALAHHFEMIDGRFSLARSSNIADILMDIAEVHAGMLRVHFDDSHIKGITAHPVSCLRLYVQMTQRMVEVYSWYGKPPVMEVL
jgi:hypothetical protein